MAEEKENKPETKSVAHPAAAAGEAQASAVQPAAQTAAAQTAAAQSAVGQQASRDYGPVPSRHDLWGVAHVYSSKNDTIVATRSVADPTVVAHGRNLRTVLKRAAKCGVKDPAIMFVPRQNIRYVF